jgi:hypothetical protein
MAKDNNDLKVKQIKNAQDRKDFAIAFYNATNNAIEMVKHEGVTSVSNEERIIKWRDWFLEQHLDYRAKVTEKIGANYNVGTAIERLEKATSRDELKKEWLSLSQDERQDPEIAKKCQELVEKYETIQ